MALTRDLAWKGASGRIPVTALVRRRPAITATVAQIRSTGSAPSAPADGSFRSMTSAPPAIAISASSGPVTLASMAVMARHYRRELGGESLGRGSTGAAQVEPAFAQHQAGDGGANRCLGLGPAPA